MTRAKKRLGQHFLHDPGIIERIVRTIDPAPGQRIVEIGPGRGAITRPLLQATGHLDVIEIDRDVVPLLQQRCAGLGSLQVHLADALEFDFQQLRGSGSPLRLVGNLPYNVSTPLLFHFLSQLSAIEDMHFMLQKEVVTRMAARPGGRDYGRLTVMLAPWVTVTPLFDIGTGAFTLTPLGLVFSATVDDLTGAINAAHFHTGAPGVNGPPVRTVTGEWDRIDSAARMMLDRVLS